MNTINEMRFVINLLQEKKKVYYREFEKLKDTDNILGVLENIEYIKFKKDKDGLFIELNNYVPQVTRIYFDKQLEELDQLKFSLDSYIALLENMFSNGRDYLKVEQVYKQLRSFRGIEND